MGDSEKEISDEEAVKEIDGEMESKQSVETDQGRFLQGLGQGQNRSLYMSQRGRFQRICLGLSRLAGWYLHRRLTNKQNKRSGKSLVSFLYAGSWFTAPGSKLESSSSQLTIPSYQHQLPHSIL